MNIFMLIVICMFGPLIAYFMFLIPVKIAVNRGIVDNRLVLIKWLSFLGLIFIVPWWIAFYLSLDDNENDEKTEPSSNIAYYNNCDLNSTIISVNILDKLEKLCVLKDRGIITEEEFNSIKERLLYTQETKISFNKKYKT